jgi:hypothetical protein
MEHNFSIDFCVIGAAKSGTTLLYSLLKQHPDVYLPHVKESHFFSRNDMQIDFFNHAYKADSCLDVNQVLKNRKNTYHSVHFFDYTQYQKLYTFAPVHALKGDVCPSYLGSKSAVNELFAHNKEMKIIAILRNPIKRIQSHYAMDLEQGKIKKINFYQDILLDDSATRKGWGLNAQYLSSGLYASQLKPYFDIFPRKNIKVIVFERFIANKSKYLNEIFQFLHLSENHSIQFEVKENKTGTPKFAFINYHLHQMGIMQYLKQFVSAEIRESLKKLWFKDITHFRVTDNDLQFLKAFYYQDITELKKLLNDPITEWDD